MNFRFPFLQMNRNIYHNNFHVKEKKQRAQSCAPTDSPQKASYNKQAKVDSDLVFDIFGISLHYDDILLISLIFFLYNEGTDDSSLFIALILLLLS